MRTREEIHALLTAGKFTVTVHSKKDPPVLVLTKGEPPIFVCSEQAMTFHLLGQRYPHHEAGPVTRMAMALHLNLTAEEAEAAGLTAAAAQAACMAWCRELVARTIAKLRARGLHKEADEIESNGEVVDIPPHDPRWGRASTLDSMGPA